MKQSSDSPAATPGREGQTPLSKAFLQIEQLNLSILIQMASYAHDSLITN